jgi:hypothetical protein
VRCISQCAFSTPNESDPPSDRPSEVVVVSHAAKMSAADKDAEIAALRQQNATLQARVKELETGTARLSVRLSGEWESYDRLREGVGGTEQPGWGA